MSETTKVPEFVDKSRLCFETCMGETTIDRHVETGLLPRPIKLGGKLVWEWSEVRDWIKNGNPETREISLEDRVREQSRQAMRRRA